MDVSVWGMAAGVLGAGSLGFWVAPDPASPGVVEFDVPTDGEAWVTVPPGEAVAAGSADRFDHHEAATTSATATHAAPIHHNPVRFLRGAECRPTGAN
ncbi:hypothetical protein GCM10025862_32940 [Arsenicicoccus piscis]|uniref:Uncharacterized protein n=1 Tax=Arsenicicoccus piscis TaxID=673954 RepID=A0ABQ6HTU7_9MICO|nr:hypothetical protein GCM10025862_32940 [Arsenicicoccus piscis]